MLPSRRQRLWKRSTESQGLTTTVPATVDRNELSSYPASFHSSKTVLGPAIPTRPQESYFSSERPLLRRSTQVASYKRAGPLHKGVSLEQGCFEVTLGSRQASYANQSTARVPRSRALQRNLTRFNNPTSHSRTWTFPSDGTNKQTIPQRNRLQFKQLSTAQSAGIDTAILTHRESNPIKIASLLDFTWPQLTERQRTSRADLEEGGDPATHTLQLVERSSQESTRAWQHKQLESEAAPSSVSTVQVHTQSFPNDNMLNPFTNVDKREFWNRTSSPQPSRFYGKPNQRAMDTVVRTQDGGIRRSSVQSNLQASSDDVGLVAGESNVSPSGDLTIKAEEDSLELPAITVSKVGLVGGASQTSIIQLPLRGSDGGSPHDTPLTPSGEDVPQCSEEDNIVGGNSFEGTGEKEKGTGEESERKPAEILPSKVQSEAGPVAGSEEGREEAQLAHPVVEQLLLRREGGSSHEDEVVSMMIRPPTRKKLLKAAEFRGGVIQTLPHLTSTIKMEYYSFINDVEETTYYAQQQTEALLLHRGYAPQTVLFISSSVPHREILQSAVKPGVIAIPYDCSELTLPGLLDLVKTALTGYMKGAKAKYIGFVCKGGPGHLYLLRGKVLTPAKLRKSAELVAFWRGLGGHMSKLLPGQSVVHLMESNVAGNKQGELLMDDLEAVMLANQVKVHSPLELSANGKEMLGLYYKLPPYRLWKMTRYTKLRLYKT